MAGEGHGNIHFFIEDLQRAGNAFFAVSAQAIQEGAADLGAAGAQSPGFEYVLTAADAAVEPHFNVAAHGRHHIG